jgi:hypothetical protein
MPADGRWDLTRRFKGLILRWQKKEFLMNTLWYTLYVCKDRCVNKPCQYFLYFFISTREFPFYNFLLRKKHVNFVGNVNILIMPQCYVNNYTFLQTWIILHHGDIYRKKYWHSLSLTRRCSSLWLSTQTRWRLFYRRSTVNICTRTVTTALFAWMNFIFGGQKSFRIYMILKEEIILKREQFIQFTNLNRSIP